MKKEFGIFKINDNSFIVKLGERSVEIFWKEISEINVYKADLMTIDEIVMEIKYTDRTLTLTEEADGWNEFTDELEKRLPVLMPGWWKKVVYPAFATNFTTIYRNTSL